MTTQATARVPTEHASKYLQQLCKHFQHKLPADFDANTGSIRFPMGEAKLGADAQTLTLNVYADDAEKLASLQDVVARHLVRFAFREELVIGWRAP